MDNKQGNHKAKNYDEAQANLTGFFILLYEIAKRERPELLEDDNKDQ